MDIAERAKGFFSHAGGSHDWEHTLRVRNLCLRIGEEEKADMEILTAAALLHDIGRVQQDSANGAVCHAEVGAMLAERLLRELQFPEKKIADVVHCIESHRFRGRAKPRTKEAKILFDSDKLDAIGAVGIGRTFLFAGEVGARLHNKDADIDKTRPYSSEDTAYREYMLKLRHIKDRLLTDEGRRIAEARHAFMVGFFERLNKEVDGEL